MNKVTRITRDKFQDQYVITVHFEAGRPLVLPAEVNENRIMLINSVLAGQMASDKE